MGEGKYQTNTLVSHRPSLRTRVCVLVTLHVGFVVDGTEFGYVFLRVSLLPQISFHHFSILISFISFHPPL